MLRDSVANQRLLGSPLSGFVYVFLGPSLLVRTVWSHFPSRTLVVEVNVQDFPEAGSKLGRFDGGRAYAPDQDALKDTYRRLMQRITAFINLPFDDLSLAQLKERLQALGRLEGATEMSFSGLPELGA